MTLSPAFLDELRARTTLSALIGKTLKLQRAGNEQKACCPFHNEKTPSFYVNDEKGFYHCFGCQAHGDAIRWLTDQNGLSFMDAVKELADRAGMEVPAADPKSQERAERAAGLHEVMEAAAAWFTEQLDGVEGAAARDYLVRRGIAPETKAEFGFGFAPDSRGKLKAALNKFTHDKLIEAGLLIKPEEDREPYDRFRGRLMFPIRDARGRCIAFSGRIVGPGEPKYLNSPDTPLFDKGRTLFNLHRAGPASRSAKRIIVVEGQMDVVALDQSGVGEVVAPLGTALTETQLIILWRYSDSPILCMDGDAAGQKAMVKAAVRALPLLAPGKTLQFVPLPAGKDPDDLIRFGTNEAPIIGLAKFILEYEFAAKPIRTPEERAAVVKRLNDLAGSINDRETREQYRAEFRREYERLAQIVRPDRQKWGARRPQSGPFVNPLLPRGSVVAASRNLRQTGLGPELGRAVLQGLVRFPALIGAHADAISELPLGQGGLSRLRALLLEAAMTHATLDQEALDTILAAGGGASLVEELGRKRGLGFSFNRRDAEPGRACRDLALVIETLAARPGLDAALEAATARLKDEGDEAAFREQQRLLAARGEAETQLATLIEADGD